MTTILACLFSGGKDSTLALHKVSATGKIPNVLITMNSKNDFSYMFHKTNIEYTSLQAAAMGIKQVFAETDGEKEEELKDLEKVLKDNNVTELITGAVASKYQKVRIEALCNKLSIKHISPLWHIDPIQELNELATNFNAIITQISAEGFNNSFLGARINNELIHKLVQVHEKYKINLSFEGGEAETFVLDAPMFKKRIAIKKSSIISNGMVGKFIIEDAMLENK